MKSALTRMALAATLVLGASAAASAAEELSSIARGGRLYDKYFQENKTAKPTTDHAAYPKKGGEYGKDAKAVAEIIRNPTHGYTEAMLTAKDVTDLSLFITKGMPDMTKYVDAGNKSKGDGAKGEGYYNTLCIGCHGADGKKITTGPSLGSVASNGWEMMHKVMNGQPGEAMPSMRAFDPQVAADIVVHLQTLPK